MRSSELLALARSVRAKNSAQKWDTTWDTRGTVAEKVSHGQNQAGTVNIEAQQQFNPTVPLSHALGPGQWDTSHESGTPLGTVVGQSGVERDGFNWKQPYAEALSELQSRCPDCVEAEHWQQCLIDAQRFLATWGDQAEALGWTADDLFGLHTPPAKPHLSYSRLSRYDCTGLLWLLQGRAVLALTDTAATIGTPSGGSVTYRKQLASPVTVAVTSRDGGVTRRSARP